MPRKLDMSIYKHMTEDEKRIFGDFWWMIDRWFRERQASVRSLEDNYQQTEEIVSFTKKLIKDTFFMHNIRIQLNTIWKRRGGEIE